MSIYFGLLGAKNWVLLEYGIEITYHWIRVYLIKHFKTKLKSLKESDYKKIIKQQILFLKFLSAIENIRLSLNRDKYYNDVNLHFLDEARFRLMAYLGEFLRASEVKSIGISTCF